jgi:3'-phosphoadenosine 5'-phosphosulfate sulfotransferase (PAPS reductase)/FAD synthetase
MTTRTPELLKKMQRYPLDLKVAFAKLRIREWYNAHGGEVYVSFSGGKDSTVLLHLVRGMYKDVPAVYSDTGLEFPEIRTFVKKFDNIEIVRPERDGKRLKFPQVIKECGWCFPSKNVAKTIYYAKKGSKWANNRLAGLNADDSESPFYDTRFVKWKFLLKSDCLISNRCCDLMKERPLYAYTKRTGRVAIVGTTADESEQRRQAWLKTGCNLFDGKRPSSKPLSIWTEQDILTYIVRNDLEIASVYGDIVTDEGSQTAMDVPGNLYKCTGEKRTGCMFCPVGCHLDKENKYMRLAKSHPRIYRYVINGGEMQGEYWLPNKEGLGLGRLLDFVGVTYPEPEKGGLT